MAARGRLGVAAVPVIGSVASVVALLGCGGKPAERSRGSQIFHQVCTACHVIGRADDTPRIVLGPGLTRTHIVNMVETGHHVIAASQRLSHLSAQDAAAVAGYVIRTNRQNK